MDLSFNNNKNNHAERLLLLVVQLLFIVNLNGQLDNSKNKNLLPNFYPVKAKPIYNDDSEGLDKCLTINQNVCSSMQYNLTKVPTWLGLSSQQEAAKRIADYDPLMNLKCSNYLKMFLCTIYFPMCSHVPKTPTVIKPCRELCLHVKEHCEKFMKSVQYNWPKDLLCDNLPESNELCVKPHDDYKLDVKERASFKTPVEEIISANNHDFMDCSAAEFNVKDLLLTPTITPSTKDTIETAATTTTKREQIVLLASDGENKLNCLGNCQANLLYRLGDKQFANHWQFIWSLICFISSMLTMVAFLNNRKRFNYPERPIFYLSLCYLFYSLGYLLRSMVGYEKAACHSINYESSMPETNDGITNKFLITPGYETSICTGIYLILAYTKLASAMWWLILGISWYLSTSRTWSPEGVESISSIFHMLAWSVPAIRVIIALILHKIDADELTGLCSVGNRNPRFFLFFEIVPMSTSLSLGLLFMLIGFVSVFRVRRDLKGPIISGLDSELYCNRRRLEKLIAKLSVFTVLYTIPSVSLLIGQIYEYTQMTNWFVSLRHLNQRNSDCINPYGIRWSEVKCHPMHSPIPEIGMLKIFASLVIGITSGIWIWANKKTLSDMQNCFGNNYKRNNGVISSEHKKGSNKNSIFKNDSSTLFRVKGHEPVSSVSSSGPTFTQLTSGVPNTNNRFNSQSNSSAAQTKNNYYAYDTSGINNSNKFASCV